MKEFLFIASASMTGFLVGSFLLISLVIVL